MLVVPPARLAVTAIAGRASGMVLRSMAHPFRNEGPETVTHFFSCLTSAPMSCKMLNTYLSPWGSEKSRPVSVRDAFPIAAAHAAKVAPEKSEGIAISNGLYDCPPLIVKREKSSAWENVMPCLLSHQSVSST